MASNGVFFLTGANARIVLNNKTVAFATDISYKITVRHASPRVLGRYEVEVNQPLSYDVEGSLTIVRYGRGIQKYMKDRAPSKVSNEGNGVGSYGVKGLSNATLGLPNLSGQMDGAADQNFNPGRLFQSKQFDIEIRQKLPKIANTGTLDLVKQVQKALGALDDILARDLTSPNAEEATIAFLRDCRFTEMDFNMSKKSPALMTLKFKARYADDDTMISRKSGVGQELS